MTSEKTIINCDIAFRFKCPKKWDRLAVTGKENIRYCNQCERNVYYCLTREDVRGHADAGECVAFETEAEMFLGEPDPKKFLW